jgi:hypothetical protein
VHAMKQLVVVGATSIAILAARAAPCRATCVGDCDGDGVVVITDLIRSVSVTLEASEIADCPAIDVNLDGRATIDEVILALDNNLGGCESRTGPAGELLFAPQDNQLNVYALDSDHAELRIPATRGTVNGQVCALPDGKGNFVIGDDTGQPAVRPGWGIYSEDGSFLQMLTLPQREGETQVPDPIGCAFDADGRLFTSAIVSTPGPDGQLSLFFPPDYVESCILDTTISTPGTITVDAGGNVYVPQFGGVLRYRPPFPDTVEECETVKGTRETFIEGGGIFAGLGIVQAANGNFYVSSVVLPSVIREFDAEGTFVRDLLPPDSAGTPAGLALDSAGDLYYSDLAIELGDSPGPVRGRGTVRKIAFDEAGNPSPPRIIAGGLTFPDGLGILPARRESLSYGGSLRRTFYNPHERTIRRDRRSPHPQVALYDRGNHHRIAGGCRGRASR